MKSKSNQLHWTENPPWESGWSGLGTILSYKECASVDDPREERKQNDRRKKKREVCVLNKREHRTSAGERLTPALCKMFITGAGIPTNDWNVYPVIELVFLITSGVARVSKLRGHSMGMQTQCVCNTHPLGDLGYYTLYRQLYYPHRNMYATFPSIPSTGYCRYAPFTRCVPHTEHFKVQQPQDTSNICWYDTWYYLKVICLGLVHCGSETFVSNFKSRQNATVWAKVGEKGAGQTGTNPGARSHHENLPLWITSEAILVTNTILSVLPVCLLHIYKNCNCRCY